MINKIFLLVPKLIEQPTWGGKYILQFKNWGNKKEFKRLKIGQSYELFSESKLRTDINSSANPSFTGELGYAMKPDKTHYQRDKNKLISLKNLIKQNPKAILGKKVLAIHGQQPGILIKFTQAKGNSFQLHVGQKNESKKWKTKPESWYYFEPGLLTLGVKTDIDWLAYKNACLILEKEIINLGQQVQKGRLSLTQAQRKTSQLVKKYNLWQYVNLVKVKKNELVDLSQCGLHHSWEEDKKNYPLGNIVYELCKDVMDPISTVRSFDQGKIKADGSVRKLNIKDYFKYINRSSKINNPNNHRIKSKLLFKDKNTKVECLLRTKYYCLDKIITNKEYSGKHTILCESYHHLFLKQGRINIMYNGNVLELTKGHSCFIPAIIKRYKIKSINKKSEILKTFLN